MLLLFQDSIPVHESISPHNPKFEKKKNRLRNCSTMIANLITIPLPKTHSSFPVTQKQTCWNPRHWAGIRCSSCLQFWTTWRTTHKFSPVDNEPNQWTHLTQLIVKKKFAPPSNCHISAAHQKIKIWYLPSTLVFFLIVGHRFWSFQDCLAVSVLHHYEVRWCFQTRWFDGLETRSFSALYSIISSMFYASFFLSNTCLGVFLSKPKPTKSGMKKFSGTK